MPKQSAPAGVAGAIDAIFHPRSIAVVGASANPDTPGYDYLHALQTFGYAGGVALLSRRGTPRCGLTYFGEPRGLRFSKAISYGNGLDLNESDFLEYFAADAETAVVGAYVEGVRDGGRFPAAPPRAAAGQPA